MSSDDRVIGWLLDSEDSDPSIRWQVMRDLLDAPETDWAAERARIETEGWGARLLSHQDGDGRWAAGAHFPGDFRFGGEEKGQPWTSTTHSLSMLREFGLDPLSEQVKRTADLIGRNCRWEHDNQPYWEGEVEPCINGITVANGTYFGVDMSPVVDRLVGEVLADGGWNCEAESGSVRSSFDTTINVLQGLLQFERTTGGTVASRTARRSGEEYLLVRGLYRRLGTGEAADMKYLHFLNPYRWHHTVLRGLDYFREVSEFTGLPPDARLADGVEHVRSRRLEDGTWPVDHIPKGRAWFPVDDGEGRPSRWVTLRAMRALRWWDGAGVSGDG